MRARASVRLLIIDPANRILLFRFTHTADALSGYSYWATPGGGVEQGEYFKQAAIRELREETGLIREDVGSCVAQRSFEMMLPNGEKVHAQERFFIVRLINQEISTDGWSANEKAVISNYHWWDLNELVTTAKTVYPSNIPSILSVSTEK
ncbi:NUDIX hydrolase [Sodalis ligni]|uniref:NUDIX domain-containing protein n=1 Tax=Sodalis ligni TaxID=2697027 RepID=A0A4R1N6Q0_9GAMM|nr:NUDIX domain-containing protein [Sodalis ligni]TCL02189.1 NUDIX domain-containing protein [Sodalis ligni]